MKLEDSIEGFKSYKERFSTWEATEQIIDDKKAFWMLKAPGSEYQKVCMYRDGCNVFIYGDYGQLVFDSMTWLATPYNLEYDNFGYQTEKMSRDCKNSISVYDGCYCQEDILDWLKDRLENRYDVDEESIPKIIDFMKDRRHDFYFDDDIIRDFCQENKFDDLENILVFVGEALENVDEYEWIHFLRSHDFSEFDEECESDLWRAGYRTHQRYFINMYAMKVCGEKLEKQGGER